MDDEVRLKYGDFDESGAIDSYDDRFNGSHSNIKCPNKNFIDYPDMVYRNTMKYGIGFTQSASGDIDKLYTLQQLKDVYDVDGDGLITPEDRFNLIHVAYDYQHRETGDTGEDDIKHRWT